MEVGGRGSMNLFWNQIIKLAPLLSIKIINLMRGMEEEEDREGTDMKMFWKMI